MVSGAISAVNPMVNGLVRVSTGASIAADGKRTPTYQDVPDVPMQVQALTYKDLVQLDGLNLNGTRKAIYIGRRVEGVVRPENRGGDLIYLPKASFTASIAGLVMDVTALASGQLAVGDAISGTGVTAGTKVTSFGTGAGGLGTYNISPTQAVDETDTMRAHTVWLVAHVLEAWPDWCKVAVTLQNSQ